MDFILLIPGIYLQKATEDQQRENRNIRQENQFLHALFGDQGVPEDEVSRLRCNGCKHAAYAIMRSIGRAVQSAPVPGIRAVPSA